VGEEQAPWSCLMWIVVSFGSLVWQREDGYVPWLCPEPMYQGLLDREGEEEVVTQVEV
jgi:hypothetical protein